MSTKTVPSSSKRLIHSIPEAREQLGNIGHSKFYDLVKTGKIRLVKIGRRSFVTYDELRSYVAKISS